MAPATASATASTRLPAIAEHLLPTIDEFDAAIEPAIEPAIYEVELEAVMAEPAMVELEVVMAELGTVGPATTPSPRLSDQEPAATRQARHGAFHMQLMAGLMNRTWV